MAGSATDTALVSRRAERFGALSYDYASRRLTFARQRRHAGTPLAAQLKEGLGAPIETTTLESVGFESGTLNSVLGTAGVKVNAGQRFLISAHVLFPINDAGLRSRVTPVIGFDYAF